jgi:sporulation protein YunB
MRFRRWRWRLRLRPQGLRRRRKSGAWFLALVILFAVLYQTLWLLEKHLHPTLVTIAQTEVKKIASEAILEGVQQQLKMGDDLDRIMKVEKAADGQVAWITINQQVQQRVYTQTTSQVTRTLHHLENKPISLSLGQVLQSNILADYGPRIPVEIWPKGDVIVDFEPKMESAGVNTVMVTMMLKVHAEMSVVVPFSTEPTVVEAKIPIATAWMMGDVPQFYYYNGALKKAESGSSHQVPMPQIKMNGDN